MGKLFVPTAVLQKPGPLDDDEFAEIRKHPEAGERLLRELGGFSAGVLRLVLDTTSGWTAPATRAVSSARSCPGSSARRRAARSCPAYADCEQRLRRRPGPS
jgi:hypothetical protein